MFVIAVSSKAVSRPIIVTNRAASFRVSGILIMGVFEGRKFDVITNPAIILPQASRLMGLITEGLFSLMGDRGRNRGVPIVTKYTTRKLYTAVKEVAISVRIRAQAFRWEVLRASIIASFEKKPAKKGVPVSARLPIVKQVEVIGIRFCSPPILRISCSSFRLWIIDPEHRNNMALKKA